MKTKLLLPWAIILSFSSAEYTGKNNFTASIYKEAITSGDENLLISPFSAQVVLALAQSGAKDQTAEEIRTALNVPKTDQEVKDLFKNRLQNLESEERYSLLTAHKIYIDRKFEIREEFKSVASNFYCSEIESIDFSKRGAVDAINHWVENRTENRIKNLVGSNSTNDGTLAVIISALYFKAIWIDQKFRGYSTKQDFFKNEDETVKVDMMGQAGAHWNYYEDAEIGAQFLEMPLRGEDANVVLVLPLEKFGLQKVERKIEEVFKSHPFKNEIVNVQMPLFKIKSTTDFKKILQKLGVRKAFVAGEADFSGIAGKKGELAVDGVLQKTYINVNPDGVEVAAASNPFLFMPWPPQATKTVTADHPFLFYIKVKGMILFVGRVTSPRVD